MMYKSILQYRPKGLQHLHVHKMRIMWLFLHTHVTRKLRAHKKKVTRTFTRTPITRKLCVS